MTIRLDIELYYRFHNITAAIGATHNGVIRNLVERYVAEHADKTQNSRTQKLAAHRSRGGQ